MSNLWELHASGSTRKPVGKKRPILTIAEKYTKLQELTRGQYQGLCPIHADGDPSFSVWTKDSGEQEHFHCFGCGAHGDVIELVKLAEPCDFTTALGIACIGDAEVEPLGLPEKSLDDERETAKFLLANLSRSFFRKNPESRWVPFHEKFSKVWDEVGRAENPLGRAIEFSRALD